MSGSDSVLRIAALGDVMLDRSVGERLAANRQDFACEPLRKLLSQCDLVFANLETTVSTRGTRFPRQDPNVAFRSHPDTLSFLIRQFTQFEMQLVSAAGRAPDKAENSRRNPMPSCTRAWTFSVFSETHLV